MISQAGQLSADDRKRNGHQRDADIVGGALRQAELAGDVAAEMLEAERGADRRRHGEHQEGRVSSCVRLAGWHMLRSCVDRSSAVSPCSDGGVQNRYLTMM